MQRGEEKKKTREKEKVDAIPFLFPSLGLYKADVSGFRLWKDMEKKLSLDV